MTPAKRKRIVLVGVGSGVLALLVFAFLPEPIPVEMAVVTRGPLLVTVEEEGVTELIERFAVLAPAAGYLRRVELEPGDPVTAGQPVASLGPPRPVPDPDERAEAAARVRAAEATSRAATAERERVERLAAAGSATRQTLERVVGEAERAEAELDAAEALLRRLDDSVEPGGGRVLTAPVDGRVLSVRRVSAGPVNPGDTLLVIGDADALQVRAEVLSEDAVRIPVGGRVAIDEWGGDAELAALVTRVEPEGFTTVSALGVEEQRVPVVALPVEPGRWAPLDPGYRVLARFVVFEDPDAVQIPSSALFRVGDEWAAFAVEDGRARRRTVTVGREAGLVTQVLGGLEPGEEVILHPSNEVEEGVRVEPL